MTLEDKELLLKDICSRLPYGVKCIVTHSRTESGQKGDCGKLITICPEGIDCLDDEGVFFSEFGDFKPYLFPLLSMTKEQKEELENLGWHFDNFEIHNVNECLGTYKEYVAHLDCFVLIDWLNKNHFDYRGLIEKGLAIDATDKNIY